MDLCKELELVHKKYKDRLHLSQGVQVLRKDHMNHKQVLHKDHKQVQVLLEYENICIRVCGWRHNRNQRTFSCISCINRASRNACVIDTSSKKTGSPSAPIGNFPLNAVIYKTDCLLLQAKMLSLVLLRLLEYF
jgi:hypothetical protein